MSDAFDLVVFDCDGVLVDSEAIYITGELAHLEQIGVVFDRSEYMGRFMGLAPALWEQQIAIEVENATGQAIPSDFFETLYHGERELMEVSLAALPGAYEAVAAVDGKRCVASSSRMVWLAWKLERTGLLDLFDPYVYSSELVDRGKPEPDLFLHAAWAMGADPGRSVVIEDSVNGVLAGKAAGMSVIGFIGGGHCLPIHGDLLADAGADTVIENFSELSGAVAELRP